MKLVLAQLNPVVGDVTGNTQQILEAVSKARAQGADVLVTPEMAVLGYPARDLMQRHGVASACEQAVETIALAAGPLTVIVGHPRNGTGRRPYCNSASVVRDGQILATYDKRLLPGYDVFDEDRHFEPGDAPCVIDVEHDGGTTRIGVLICEDLWRATDVISQTRYTDDPIDETVAAGAEVLVSLNASPFVIGKTQRHRARMAAIARKTKRPVVAVHQVGANDDLVFEGRSSVFDSDGRLVEELPAFQPAVRTVRVGIKSNAIAARDEPMRDLFGALVLGIGDYCRKTGHRDVLLGLSGGIDSALTCALACAALGPEHVRGVLMPSKYSSQGSIDDARALAANLGMSAPDLISIESPHNVLGESIGSSLPVDAPGFTDENIQARLRGVILMALSNASGALVLSTSNKSESAVGYTTLYGDMCGAIAPIADLLKTQVYDLSRWINANHGSLGFRREPIPGESITKPPSAELRPDQTDQDTLPPYEILDEIVDRVINLEQSAEQIIEETSIAGDIVREWMRRIDMNQYKRDQASVVLKVSARAFGRGRPMPIVMRDSRRMPAGVATPDAARS